MTRLEPELAATAAEGGVAAAIRGPMRILVVDDDPTNRLLVRAVLSRSAQPAIARAAVTEAETLEAAWRALGAAQPDALILDVRLPDGSGLELARHLATLPADERPRVVVMSASVLAAQRDEAVRAGCDAFLAKPFRPAELLDLLASWVTAAG